MAKMMNNVEGWKPTLLMVLVQVIFAGVNISMKLATNDGMDPRVLVAYRLLFAIVFIVPVSFFVERKKRPKLTWKVLFFAFLSGIFGGALGINLYLESLVLTSATFITAMNNLLPAFTFLVAVCLRLEEFGWHTLAGKSKVFGTFFGLSGAMLFTFYKGPKITIWRTNINLLNTTSYNHYSSQELEGSNHALGVILSMMTFVVYSLWFIVQAKAAQPYPAPLSFTALMILMASILGFVSAVCMQRDWNQWKLGWNIRLFTVAYTGIMGTGVMYTLITLCIAMRGPLFASAFCPLTLIIVAVAASLVLEESLHLGSLLGSILIICGLYFVLWGKSKEIKMIKNGTNPEKDAKVEGQVREKSNEKNINQLVQEENVKDKAPEIQIKFGISPSRDGNFSPV